MTLTEFFKHGEDRGVTQWHIEIRRHGGLPEYHVSGWNEETPIEGFFTKFKIDQTVHGEEVIV